MRKIPQTYGLEIPDDDYKMAAVMDNDRANFESQNNWFYVGADERDSSFAKVGITTGDMSSRSSYSGNPNFYLFCGFQCQHNIEKSRLRRIEQNVLSHLDEVYPGKRARHVDSQRLSECYYDINFLDFFICVHEYLLEHHEGDFQTSYFGDNEGYALSWQFNPRLKREVIMRFLRSILHW